jgi:hypothetical protein
MESRNNPYFSRFDAVNNKYESQQLLDIRSIIPPLQPYNEVNNWFHADDETKKTMTEQIDMEMVQF